MLNFSNMAFVCRIYLFLRGKEPLPVQSFRGVLLKSPNSKTGWAGNYVCTSWVWLQTQCCDLIFTKMQITHTCLCCTFLPIWDCVKCLKQPWLPRTCQNGNVETKELVERAPLLVKKSPFILFTSLGHGQTSWNEFVSWRCNFCTLHSYAFKFAVWPDMTRHWEMCLGFLWASGLELQTCCIETCFFQRKNVSTTSYTFWGLMFRFKEFFVGNCFHTVIPI